MSTFVFILKYSVNSNIIIDVERNDHIMEVGERLRYIRTSKKISIYKLSQITGISQNHISDLELGKRQPSVDTLRRLIAPLGITLSELFNESDSVTILSDEERQLVENYRTLPNDKAETLLKLSSQLNK